MEEYEVSYESEESDRVITDVGVFQPVKVLGRGTFGTVWKAVWELPSGQLHDVALKRIRMEPETSYPEHDLVASFSHSNIISVYDRFYSYNAYGNGHLNLVFEYVSGMDLRMYISQMREYLHVNSVAHRDLKPANIMVRNEDGMVKVIDFGHAKVMKDPNGGSENYSTCYCVSRHYRAPELLLGNIHYGVQLDIWSVGCILAEMILGTPIFPGEDDEDQMFRIIAILGSPTIDDIEELAPHWTDSSQLIADTPISAIPFDQLLPKRYAMFADILSHMLVYNPLHRWSARQLLDHPMFRSES